MKYEPIPDRPEEFIKNLAKDIFNDKVFTAFMIPEAQRQHMLPMVFMPLLFMGPRKPHDREDMTALLRENKIYEILEEDEEKEAYETKFLPSIGLVYEYYADENGNHNSLPRSINGFPSFMSCQFLNLQDTDKLRDFYEKYAEIRKQADNF